MTNFSTYSVTEEAFLHSSLHELVKVWASGSGKASFHLDICDGVAELQLNFKLGHPSQSHCDQYVPQHHHLHDKQEGYQPRRRRRKGPARRERDRLRAAEHHARTTQTPQGVILPFNGRILATKPRISSSNHKSQFDDSTAAPAVKATAATAVTPSTSRPPLPVVLHQGMSTLKSTLHCSSPTTQRNFSKICSFWKEDLQDERRRPLDKAV